MTRSKRSSGEGSIYFSNALNTWVAEIVLPDGRKKRKKNKRQSVVKSWLDGQKETVRRGTWIANENVRYGDFLDRYMRDVAAPNLRPRTLENYGSAIKNRIKPTLGEMKVSAIRPDHLHRLYSDLLNEGLSKYSVKYIHAVIRKSLGIASTWGLVSRNVAELVSPPTPEIREIKPLTVGEVKRLLKVLEGNYLYAYYLLIATTGIRKSEGLALQKQNLDLAKGTVTIKHSITQVRGQGLVLGEPKSEKSKRQLALPPITLNALKRHLTDYPSESNFVFSTASGKPISPLNVINHFKKFLKRAGLPQETRIHDIRHSVISWWLKSGMNIREVQELAGHAQASTTLKIYSHVLPGYNEEAAKKIEGLFSTE